MPGRNRRSVLAGSATLLTGSFLVSNGAVGADGGSDETNETDDTDDSDDTNERNLGLEVEVDDSGHVDDHSTTKFEICVRNHGDETVSVPVTLEIGHVDEDVDTLELDPGESEVEEAGYIYPRSLGPGEHEWTVTAGEVTETGTFVVEADEDYEDREDGFHVSIFDPDDAVGSEVVRETDDGQDTASFYFHTNIMNYSYEAAEGVRIFEVDDTDVLNEWPLEFEPRETKQTYAFFSLPVGEYEWTTTFGEVTKSGRLRVVPGEEDC